VDNTWDSNSVIDLVFLPPDNRGFGQHMLYPDIHKPSDHALLTIKVGITETNIDLSFRSISKDSEEEDITNGHLLFVMGALILQRAQKCEVRQVTKDVVKSEV